MGTLSFWGWGYEENFPGEDEIDYLRDRIEERFGETPDPRPEPTIREITLPDPDHPIPAELSSFSSASRRERALHTYGKGYPDLVRGFRGNYEAAPDFVCHPENEDQLRSIMDWAKKAGAILVPVGGSTNVVRGTEPERRDDASALVAVSLRAFNELLDVDETSRVARLEAGMLGPEIEDKLAEHGLTLRHYPQSFEFSTLGGWIATRSAGHFATVETRIDDLTVSCRCVTPEGTLETPDYPSSGAGPDPDRLLFGSEGTLGLITEASMRVRPRPTYRAGATLAFDSFLDGVEACRKLAQSGLNPANARLVSRDEIELYQLDDDPAHLLFLGFESASVPVEPNLDRAAELLRDQKATLRDDYRTTDREKPDKESGDEWKRAFFEAPYLYNGLVRLGVIVDTFETCCRWNRFEELHEELMTRLQKLLEEECGDGLVTARITHLYPEGPAPYYTVLAPSGGENPLRKWSSIKGTASRIIREHDATITHHHAVGRRHRSSYLEESPGLFQDALVSVKETLDPDRLLNPGVLLDSPAGDER